jgi:hypothetical protein
MSENVEGIEIDVYGASDALDDWKCDRIIVPINQLDALSLYAVQKLLTPTGDNVEATNMARLIRTAVKGVLMMYGDKILTLLMGKDHPKPAKKDDIVEWYSKMFAKLLLYGASQYRYELHTIESEDEIGNIKVTSNFSTVPISSSVPTV